MGDESAGACVEGCGCGGVSARLLCGNGCCAGKESVMMRRRRLCGRANVWDVEVCGRGESVRTEYEERGERLCCSDAKDATSELCF